MDMRKNARLTPRGRERIVNLAASGQTPKANGGDHFLFLGTYGTKGDCGD